MEEQEKLPNKEVELESRTEQGPASPSISIKEVEALYADRKKLIEELKPFVYRKLYNDMSEKVEFEKEQFEKLLNWQSAKEEVLSHYSFVLNPYFFEQKFFNESTQ